MPASVTYFPTESVTVTDSVKSVTVTDDPVICHRDRSVKSVTVTDDPVICHRDRLSTPPSVLKILCPEIVQIYCRLYKIGHSDICILQMHSTQIRQ